MRILFLILVIANVVAFIWFGWLRSPTPVPIAATPLPHVRPLKLITELTPAQRQALAQPTELAAKSGSASDAAVRKISGEVCMSYGPFPSTEASQAGIARLQGDGVTVSRQVVPGKVRLGYWVYLPPFGSRAEAEAAAKLLKSRGVKDLYVVAEAANRNAISLGVFSDRYGALAHQKKIRQMGYHPLLTERFRESPRYWLDVHGPQYRLPAASAFADLDEGDISIGRAACGTAPSP